MALGQSGHTTEFGWFKDDTPDTEIRRVTLHEFGHALGLIHEHQSPAAGIPWDKEKVYAYFKRESPPWDANTVDHNIFDRYSASSTNYSQFDPQSIMIYAVSADWTLDGSSYPENNDLSATDKKYIGQWLISLITFTLVDEPVELCVTRLRYAQIHRFFCSRNVAEVE